MVHDFHHFSQIPVIFCFHSPISSTQNLIRFIFDHSFMQISSIYPFTHCHIAVIWYLCVHLCSFHSCFFHHFLQSFSFSVHFTRLGRHCNKEKLTKAKLWRTVKGKERHPQTSRQRKMLCGHGQRRRQWNTLAPERKTQQRSCRIL